MTVPVKAQPWLNLVAIETARRCFLTDPSLPNPPIQWDFPGLSSQSIDQLWMDRTFVVPTATGAFRQFCAHYALDEGWDQGTLTILDSGGYSHVFTWQYCLERGFEVESFIS